MRILLTGKNGQLGIELACALRGKTELITTGRAELDLRDADAIRQIVRDTRPGIIINAAAYTEVDLAEKEEEQAFAVNAAAPRVLAEEAKRLNALLVHYSTDYVFDGLKPSAYCEIDPTHPINVYGKTKLAGELGIVQSGAAHIIFRTSWIYSAHGKNFLLTILRLAKERNALSVVDDQWGAPTSARTIAEATAQILMSDVARSRSNGYAALKAITGIYHLTAAGVTTWHGFARAIVEDAPLYLREPLLLTPDHIAPISASEYPRPARRPRNSTMDGKKLRLVFGITLPEWRSDLRRCLAGMVQE